jgi:hypothetical protein
MATFKFSSAGGKSDPLTTQEREQIQENLIAFCDGLPDDLITELCDVVVNFGKN